MIPAAGPAPRVRLPEIADHTLDNGLRVLVVPLPGVPLVQLRLRVKLAGDPDPAPMDLLADSLLSGTTRRSDTDLAAALQEVGGRLSAQATPDQFAVGGSGLANGLDRLLELLAEVLREAAYPAEAVEGKRRRLVERLVIHHSRPATVARAEVLARLHGTHPSAHEVPEPEEVARVEVAHLQALHLERLAPAAGVLVLAGDLEPDAALATVADALNAWVGPTLVERANQPWMPPFPPPQPGPAVVVERAGAVQTNIRYAGLAVPRSDPSFPALHLAVLAFGGYFSSRLVANLRERHGYTYSPRSHLEHQRASSRLLIAADVGTDVTAPALEQLRHELDRMLAEPLAEAELEAARRYTLGTIAIGMASQASLAGTLAQLWVEGLGAQFLLEYADALGNVAADDALAAARAHLDPAALVSVLVGPPALTSSSRSTTR